ncbi:MAG: redoxin domain-containing protein, partial [Planctomycetales bacterium]|nr:redoxin domain-containing protein [Planctomycetales bacterium]
GDELTADVKKRVADAAKSFAALVRKKAVKADAEFTDFGGLRPGVVPAGAQGTTEDITVYESVWAMMLSGGQHEQVQLGSLIRVGDGWRVIDAPTIGDETQMAAGLFFSPGNAAGGGQTGAPSNEKMQEILTAMEKLDEQMATAEPREMAQITAKRADLIQRMAEASSSRSEQEQWLRQLADTLSAAVQGGQYPQGVDRLKALEASLAKSRASDALQTHFEFRRMQAENGLRFSDPKANHAKLQEAWIEELGQFVKSHSKSEHAAEALLQLGMYSEFAGDTEQAAEWYKQLADGFPASPNASKAKGALTRLNCVGRSIALKGKSIDGKQIDLAQYRGKAVLLHYWSTQGTTSQADHAVIKDVYAKYGGKSFDVIGVNLDYSREDLVNYLRENRLPWKQIYEDGGFESRPANDMGVIILPLFVLVGPDGSVVSNSLQAAELEAELKQIFNGGSAARPNASRR